MHEAELRSGRLGVVVIGRNEGAKLERCLRSVLGAAWPIVYVDSCSRDGSVELARRLGVDVVELETPPPCTVARARNMGFARATEIVPDLELVQFLDADSELSPGWCAAACEAIADRPSTAVVYGGLRERAPDRSLLSRVYHVGFDRRLMPADVCPGMSVMRAESFRAVGGFRADLLGYEDREIATRLRRAGWRVERLSAEMAVHDVGPQSFGEWWCRRLRGGHALAHERSMCSPAPPMVVRASYSAWFWGLLLPVAAIGAGCVRPAAFLLLPLGYLALFTRVARRISAWGFAPADASFYAGAIVLAKLPEALGQLRFHWQRGAGAEKRPVRPLTRDGGT